MNWAAKLAPHAKLLTSISLGLMLMILIALLRKNKYNLSCIKVVSLMLFLLVAGVSGSYILFYFENGFWGGGSYFGAVLIAPIVLIPAGLILKIPYKTMTSICAPCECIMLATLKIHCAMLGCCSGAEWFQKIVPLPLQIIEMLAALIVMFILIRIEASQNETEYLYAYYLLIYGAIRFILNTFRDGISPYVWIFPPGHFWALISIVLGYLILKCRNKAVNKV